MAVSASNIYSYSLLNLAWGVQRLQGPRRGSSAVAEQCDPTSKRVSVITI